MQLILIVETVHCGHDGVDKVSVTPLIENDDTANLNWQHLLNKFPHLKVEAVIVAPNRIALKMHNCLKAPEYRYIPPG